MKLIHSLKSWKTLNDALRNCTENDAKQLLTNERIGAARPRFLIRIHSRFNKLRAAREREELKRIQYDRAMADEVGR
jgi:hypothetical protein